jgi:hypothetical protein
MCLFDFAAGSVYFYTHNGSSWSRQAKILPADEAAGGDRFGTSVSLYTSSALIGASDDGDNGGAGEYSELWRCDKCTTV